MKKMLAVIAALMCLFMSVAACAEVELLYENVGDVDWVNGTNLFSVTTDTGCYITNMNGDVLTDAIYNSFYYRYGYIEAVNVNGDLNCYGMFDQSGRIVVPFEYGTLEVKGENWAVGVVLEQSTEADYDYSSWSGNYYIATRYDVYHLPEGNKVAEFGRSEFDDVYAVNGCLNIRDDNGVVTTYDAGFNALGTASSLADDEFAPPAYTDYREEGKYGIVDINGNVILPPTYEMIFIRNNYALVSGENGEGLFRIDTAELVVPAEYSAVVQMGYQATSPSGNSSYECMGYYCVEVDDKIAFLNAAGEMTCQPKHTTDEAQLNGASYTVEYDDGSVLLVAADGVETMLSGYESVDAFSNGRGLYYRVYNENYQQALIDWHGEIIIPFAQNQSITMSGCGQYLLVGNYSEGSAVYRLTYPGETVTAVAPAPVAEAETADGESAGIDQIASSITGSMGNILGGGENEETEEAPSEDTSAEEAPAGDNSSVVNLLNSAVTLLNTDAAANGTAAVALLETSVGMLAGQDDAAGLISSAITLLGIDAEANGSAAVSLIESAIAMLQ